VPPLLLPDEPPDELEPPAPEDPPAGLPELPEFPELPDEPLELPEELDEPPKPDPPDEPEELPDELPDELEEVPCEPMLPELDPVVPASSNCHGWVVALPLQPGATHKIIATDPQIGNTYLRMRSSQVERALVRRLYQVPDPPFWAPRLRCE
jgi:hypothetical protein